MMDQVQNPGVIAPLTPAFERVKEMLFRPFDAARWFIIGFCAWLATLGQGGANFGGNYGGGDRRGGREVFEEARRYVLDNLSWLIPLALAVVFLVVVIWLVLTWLSSRGRFMFLQCVRENVAEVQAPWTRYAAHADSLFAFRVVLGLVSVGVILPLVVGGVVLIVGLSRSRGPDVLAVLGAIGLVFLVTVLCVGFAVVAKLTTDFVVPIMAERHTRCLDGWREFGSLARSRLGSFVLYLVFQVLIHLVIGVAVFALVVVTCCCAGCLLAIPYLGTVLYLPVLIFHRAYSLYFLAQFGPEYDVFAQVPTGAGVLPPGPG